MSLPSSPSLTASSFDSELAAMLDADLDADDDEKGPPTDVTSTGSGELMETISLAPVRELSFSADPSLLQEIAAADAQDAQGTDAQSDFQFAFIPPSEVPPSTSIPPMKSAWVPRGGLSVSDFDPGSSRQELSEAVDEDRGESGRAKRRKLETPGESKGGAECTHPLYVFGLCAKCGRPKPIDEDANEERPSTTTLKHLGAKYVEVTEREAKRIRKASLLSLLNARKLVLILDLDHTLLNSSKASDITPEHRRLLDDILQRQKSQPSPLLYHLEDKGLWTKLRPYIREFLEELRKLYELHIYTMGDKNYARAIAEILDPTQELFAGRVISQSDSTSTFQKDLDVTLSSDQHVLILDDTEHVWPRHIGNLIQINRYHFFPSSIRLWHPTATSLLEEGRDESPRRGQLAVCLRVLTLVHQAFFEEGPLPLEERDVRVILKNVRAEVLQGVSVVFSRLWPMDANSFDQPYWKMAEALGADCNMYYDPERTTHVITDPQHGMGTEKVRQALAEGKVVVGPRWLESCKYNWAKMDEEPFLAVNLRGEGTANGGQAPPASAIGDLLTVLKAAGQVTEEGDKGMT